MKRFLFLLILFISVFNIYSADYYVSSSGTDNESCGAIGTPCQTIQYAINKLSAGDTLYIREGIYRETITITNDGSRLSVEQIEKMVAEAEKFKDDDKKIQEYNYQATKESIEMILCLSPSTTFSDLPVSRLTL